MALATPPTEDARALAMRALKRWAEHGLDPDNEEHVAAYLLARQTSQRPSVARVNKLLERKEEAMTDGVTLKTPFWLVPKVNFPKGVPQKLVHLTVTEAELRKTHKVKQGSDFGNVFIFDMAADRSVLGLRVMKVEFFQTMASTMRDMAEDPLALSGPNLDAGAATSAASALVPAASAQEQKEDAPTEPTKKKQKVLKLMNSHSGSEDNKEEAEAATLEKVIRKIKVHRCNESFYYHYNPHVFPC